MPELTHFRCPQPCLGRPPATIQACGRSPAATLRATAHWPLRPGTPASMDAFGGRHCSVSSEGTGRSAPPGALAFPRPLATRPGASAGTGPACCLLSDRKPVPELSVNPGQSPASLESQLTPQFLLLSSSRSERGTRSPGGTMSPINLLSSPAPSTIHLPLATAFSLNLCPYSGIIIENGQKTKTPQKSGKGSELDRSDRAKPNIILWPAVLSVSADKVASPRGNLCSCAGPRANAVPPLQHTTHVNEGRERSNR